MDLFIKHPYIKVQTDDLLGVVCRTHLFRTNTHQEKITASTVDNELSEKCSIHGEDDLNVTKTSSKSSSF